MRTIFLSAMIFLISCTSFKEEIISNINNSNDVVPILFEAWKEKKISFVEKKLGSPTTIEEKEHTILYFYNDSIVKKFTLLTVKTNKSGDILSMFYLLSDDNSNVKKDWIVSQFSNYQWREVALPITDHHAIVQKMVLLNDEKKISAGFLQKFKNNQIEYLYFDVEEENYKAKNMFFWD